MDTFGLVVVLSSLFVTLVAVLGVIHATAESEKRMWHLVKPLADRMLTACDKSIEAKYAENETATPAKPKPAVDRQPPEPQPDFVAENPVLNDPFG